MSRTRVRVAGSWLDLPSGPRGPQGIPGPNGATGGGGMITAYITGLLVAGVGVNRLYNDTGGDIEIAGIRVNIATPPLGGPAKFDANLDGVTMFTTQANRPTIAAGAYTSGLAIPDVLIWPSGQYLTADVDLIGTSYAGAGATMQIGLA